MQQILQKFGGKYKDYNPLSSKIIQYNEFLMDYNRLRGPKV